MSACGGSGFGGGGGGRVATDVFSRHEDPKIIVHGRNVLTIHMLLSFFISWGYAPMFLSSQNPSFVI